MSGRGGASRARRLAAVSLALALAALGVGGGPASSPVAASCGASQPVDEAVLLGPIVFVGTVISLDNLGRWATVKVEERWSGARDLPDTVAVHGGPEPGATTTIDRAFTKVRYLFVVSVGTDGFLADNACTGTRPWTADLARLRPAGVSAAPDTVVLSPLEVLDTIDLAPVAALVLALLVVVVAYIWILRARRRPPDWMR